MVHGNETTADGSNSNPNGVAEGEYAGGLTDGIVDSELQ